jgi:molybdopterin/thiamine biosynthesis adenylyltransferase
MGYESLTPREKRRYAKQIMLGGIGTEGQEKLKNARILVVGAGGLGCSILQYLTVAGTGDIAIAEFDMVNESNLQRQVLYGSNDVGKLKSIIAKDRLENLNSLVKIEIYNLKIEPSNSLKILKKFDVIVDATDNLDARYVISDSCVFLDKPMVHGSIYKWEGMVSVFNYRGGPTYRCFNPDQEEKNFRNPPPADTGLFGVLPGLTGIMMANEVIKIVTDTGDVLSGKALVFNILTNTFNTFTIKNIPGNHKTENLKTIKLDKQP